MTLNEVRRIIDSVDSQMKPLFLSRMDCALEVAAAKAATGGDVFVPEREDEIIAVRTADTGEDVKEAYNEFLRHLMSLSRRHQYRTLTKMQEETVMGALVKAGLDPMKPHEYVSVRFHDSRRESRLHLVLTAVVLNGIAVHSMNVESKQDIQEVTICLEGNVNKEDMKCLLCQIGKETREFEILGLK